LLKNDHFEAATASDPFVGGDELSKMAYLNSLPRIRHILMSSSKEDMEHLVNCLRVLVSKQEYIKF